MAVVKPVPKDSAAVGLKPIFEDMTKKFGKVPNIFGVMAHRPDALAKFLPFYGAATSEGTVEPKLKEFAYLKTSLVNGCEY